MVGVPGRSKGCLTCLSRKKKCDLQKPICWNCVRGRFVCGGYQRNVVMVHATSDGRKSQYRASEGKLKRMATNGALLTDVRQQGLIRAALEAECFDAFWQLYLPSARRACHNGTDPALISWATWTQAKVAENSTMRCALLAVCIGKVGWLNNDKAFTERGMELYGRALKQVSVGLQQPERIQKTETIAICRLLALYEQLNERKSSTRNWQGHVNGLVNLIKMQPAEAYVFEGNHHLFLEIRFNAAVSALASRKSTFLCAPEWIEKPFIGKIKGAVHTMCDLLLILPGILEEFDCLLNGTNTPGIDRRADLLKARCWHLDEQLQDWHRDSMRRLLPRFTSEDARYLLSRIGQPPQDHIVDILARADPEPLYAMSLYWPCCIILYSLMPALYQMFPPALQLAMDFFQIPRMDTLRYASAIARSIKHFLHPSTGLASATAVAFPISCVCQSVYYMDRSGTAPEYYTELEKLLNEISDAAKDTFMGAYIHDLLRDEAPGTPAFRTRVERWHEVSEISTATSFNRLLPVPLVWC